MSWRVALALDTLLDEVNARAPKRSTASDGSIGDADHASRTSDHNPWVPPPNGGVVTARDITDDPANGHNATELAEFLRLSRDPRIKYVIDQGRMFSSYPTSTCPAWTWRSYSGVNAHLQHTHVSVQPTPSLYDSTRPWGWADKEAPMTAGDFVAGVAKGDKGGQVRYWQRKMNRAVPAEHRIVADGDYGAATVALLKRITGGDGDQIGAVQADRIEHAIDVHARMKAGGGKVDIDKLAREVAEELTVTVSMK